MPILEAEIYSVLTGSTLITALTSARVFPVIAPENPTQPYILYSRSGGGQLNGLSGFQDHENPSIQIDVYAKEYLTGKTIARNVHKAMNSATTFKSILTSDNDLYMDEVKAHRIVMDFSCMNATT